MSNFHDILERLGLSQYHDVFVEEAFDSWDVLLDITEADLDALGVKLGHRRILQRAIAESRSGSLAQGQSLIDPNLQAASGKDDANRSDDEGGSTKTGNAGSTRAKRKYRRHPKADEHAPERPPSAYVLFSNQIREELKPQELSFTEIAKLVGEKWQVLSPIQKEPYENKSQAMKETYYQVLAEYKKTPKFEEYRAYLEDFKVKHDQSQPDGKQARKKTASAPSARRTSIEGRTSLTGQANSAWSATDGWLSQPGRRTSGARSPATDPSRAVLDWRSQTALVGTPNYEAQTRPSDPDYTASPRYSPGINTAHNHFYSHQQLPTILPQQQQHLPSTSFRPLEPGLSTRTIAPHTLPATFNPGPSRFEAPSPTSSNTSLWPPLAVDRSARRTHSRHHDAIPRLPHDETSGSTTASSAGTSYNSASTGNTNPITGPNTSSYPPSSVSGPAYSNVPMLTHQGSSDSMQLGGIGSNRHLPPPIPTRMNANNNTNGLPPPSPRASVGPGAQEMDAAAVQASIATLLRAGEHVGYAAAPTGYGGNSAGEQMGCAGGTGTGAGSRAGSRSQSRSRGGSGSTGGGGLPHRKKQASGGSCDSEETARP